MFKNSIKNVAVVFIVVAFCSLALLLVTASAAQQSSVTRKILLKEDSAIPGYEEALVAVEIPAGGREGRHTHPGSVMIYVQEGTLTFTTKESQQPPINPETLCTSSPARFTRVSTTARRQSKSSRLSSSRRACP